MASVARSTVLARRFFLGFLRCCLRRPWCRRSYAGHRSSVSVSCWRLAIVCKALPWENFPLLRTYIHTLISYPCILFASFLVGNSLYFPPGYTLEKVVHSRVKKGYLSSFSINITSRAWGRGSMNRRVRRHNGLRESPSGVSDGASDKRSPWMICHGGPQQERAPSSTGERSPSLPCSLTTRKWRPITYSQARIKPWANPQAPSKWYTIRWKAATPTLQRTRKRSQKALRRREARHNESVECLAYSFGKTCQGGLSVACTST